MVWRGILAGASWRLKNPDIEEAKPSAGTSVALGGPLRSGGRTCKTGRLDGEREQKGVGDGWIVDRVAEDIENMGTRRSR